MTDYTELVKALRLCQFGECGCGKCYYKELKGDWCTEDNHPEFFDCDDKLKLDAAAAIEELQAEVEELKAKKMKLAENSLRFVGKVRELDKRRFEPKRGKWITHPEVKNIYGGVYIECPFCGEKYVVQNVSDEKFCRNCGADLMAKLAAHIGQENEIENRRYQTR